MRALDALAYFPSAFRKFALRFSIVIWINHGTRLVFLRLSAKGSSRRSAAMCNASGAGLPLTRAPGPKPTLEAEICGAARLNGIGHSCIAQHFHGPDDRSAGLSAVRRECSYGAATIRAIRTKGRADVRYSRGKWPDRQRYPECHKRRRAAATLSEQFAVACSCSIDRAS